MADEEVLQVGLPAGAEGTLLAQREHAFERDEHQAQHQQFQHEVVQPGGKGARRAAVHRLDLGAAQQQRHRAQRQPGHRMALRTALQQQGQRGQRQRRQDAELQQAAQRVQVRQVQRQRVLRHQPVGQQETQLAEHAQHAQQARGHAGALAQGQACGGGRRGIHGSAA